MKFAAFLRGINVGGHRVTTDQFKACFAEMGFDGVATFRASGNVVFETGERSVRKLTTQIEEGLQATLGYAVATFLRTPTDMARMAAFEPFAAKSVAESKGKLQILMLASRPSAGTREEILAMATKDDQLAIDAAEIYWLPKGGTQESTLDFKAVGRALGLTTTRTKGTVELMTAKYFAD